jgi:Ankyrin repeats (3 copies)
VGRDWKAVAAQIGSRTVVQTRTHAQKYFQKLSKCDSSGGNSSGDEADKLGTSAGSKKKQPSQQPQQRPPASIIKTVLSIPGNQRAGASSSKPTAVQKSPELLPPPDNNTRTISSIPFPPQARMSTPVASQAGPLSPLSALATVSRFDRRGSQTTLSAAQVISNLSQAKPRAAVDSIENPTSLFQPTVAPTVGSAVPGTEPARHGFITDANAVPAPTVVAGAPRLAYFSNMGGSAFRGQGSAAVPASAVAPTLRALTRIVAPDPASSLSCGDFPEPSPAATGKRKLAEIAAARMLAAGVVGTGTDESEGDDGGESPLEEKGRNVVQSMSVTDDGPPTPPPAEMEAATRDLGRFPKPPISFPAPATGKAGSLQIVNPATLGVKYDAGHRRGRGSPQTPWDGDIESLVYTTSSSAAPSSEGPQAQIKFESSSSHGNTTNSAADQRVHPVCSPPSGYGRSDLHRLVCEGDVATLQTLLNRLQPDVIQKHLRLADEAGYRPIHSAAAVSLACRPATEAFMVTAFELVSMLHQAGADALQSDGDGNTPLHWAARAGNRGAAEFLLNQGRCHPDVVNHQKETPLHWAMRAGIQGIEVVTTLLQHGARSSVQNADYRRPIDVAGDGFLDEDWSPAALQRQDLRKHRETNSREYKKALKTSSLSRQRARQNVFTQSSQSRTLVLHHPECNGHLPKSNADWEAPDRISVILNRVFHPASKTLGSPTDNDDQATASTSILPHEISISKEFERAKLGLLKRIHTTEYLSFVHDLSKDLERQLTERGGNSGDDTEDSAWIGEQPIVPFTPMVQRTMIKAAESNIKHGSYSDTSFSAGSLRAARRATGAVQHAVDW